MTRSLPFDELGDRKPAPNPDQPQREIPMHRHKPTPQAERQKIIDQIRKQHGL